MKKPYIKRISNVAGFHVWYVNGYWIRKHIDADFNNFGQHYRFKFIPKHEFWIDKENGKSEVKYYVEHLLVENKLMEAGESYNNAIDKADLIEKAERGKNKFIAKIEKQHLLIIDDFGIQPLDVQSRSALMEIIEDRHGKSSTIITSQVPVSKWHDIIGEQTIADAILDRIVHDAHRIEMKGESLRKKKLSISEEQIDLINLKN